MKGYPAWFKAAFIHGLVLMLFFSGVFLIPTTLVSRLQWDIVWRLSSEARIPVTAIHVLFGFLIAALIGALWSIHMRYWWRKNQGRFSGATLLSAFVILVLTGVVILYVAQEDILSATSLIHSILGLVLSALYIWHSYLRLS